MTTTTTVSLRALIDRGVQLRPHEAIAIVQQLIHSDADVELARPFGPPTIDTLLLTRFSYGQTWAASWLPDGRHVCFSHEDRLIVLSLDDRRLRSYPTPVSGRLVRTPAVAPDGSRVVFQVWRDGVWLLDLRTGAMRRILKDPTAEEFAWAPDGSRVAYHTRRAGSWAIEVLSPV